MPSTKYYLSEFERQLRLQNVAKSTIDTYCGAVKLCILKIFKDPRAITQREVEDYLLTLKSSKYKAQSLYALRKFYTCVLKMPTHLQAVPVPKQEKFIPNTLNTQEVQRI